MVYLRMCLLNVMLFCGSVIAQVPQTLSYQGVLKDASGNLVPDGTYQMTFNLYTDANGGSPVWNEVQMIPAAGGIFNVILGTVNPLTVGFDEPYWLGVTIGTGGELSPRIQLTSSAYSFMARNVPDSSIVTARIADGAVTQAKLSPGLSLPPGGTAGGDLSGSYPNPTIAPGAVTLPKINSSGANAGNVLTYNGSNLAWQTPATGIGGSGIDTYIPRFTGTNTLGNSSMIYGSNWGGSIGIGATPDGQDTKFLVQHLAFVGETLPPYLARFQTRTATIPSVITDYAYFKSDGSAFIKKNLVVGGPGQMDPESWAILVENPSGSGVVGQGYVGVYGYGKSDGYGVMGATQGGGGPGVYCYGRFIATGTKNFQIDHPLEPASKFLNHYCTEGEQPLNAYSGNIRLDQNGEADVKLPNYFESINRDYRYQLTPVGSAMPDLHIAQKIENNRFRIGGGKAGAEVSWRVEGVRNDRWAIEHGTPVETDKPAEQKGKYLHPELFGQPESMGIRYRGNMRQNDGLSAELIRSAE